MPNEDSVFDPDAVNDDTNAVTVDVLVGEGRKYKSPDELAKAYVNADSFIEQLKRDLATAKAEADVLKNASTPNSNANGNADPVNPNTPSTEDKNAPNAGGDDWRAKVRAEIENLTQEERFKKNILDAQEKMVEVYGSKEAAAKAIRERAQSLNVSVKWLEETAASSPSAFYATMEIQRQDAKSNNTPTSRSEVVTPTNANTGERTFRYYTELRKTDLGKYYSPAVQKEMFDQAKKLGQAFYN